MQENTKQAENSGVLVIGGGVGGIKTAMDLSEAGRDVVLIDKAPSIGGLMTRLDRTFPTNNCDLCAPFPVVSESGRQEHIELLPLTELSALEGDAGDFTATLVRKPRYIDAETCTACGECLQTFPECVVLLPGWITGRPPACGIPSPHPWPIPSTWTSATDAGALAACCPAGAIHDGDETDLRDPQHRFGGAGHRARSCSIPTPLDNYGHSDYPDVVTGLEYERIMSASGPTGGTLVRPSDGRQPKKVAWIQCVGSRVSIRRMCPIAPASAACTPSRRPSSPRSGSRTTSRPPFSTWTCAPSARTTSYCQRARRIRRAFRALQTSQRGSPGSVRKRHG
jgi:heterodisulfide reductase subunit A